MNQQAQRVIDKCGGVAIVADIVGVHISRVHRWTYDKTRGGTDGLIPAQHHQTILRGARARGIDLTPDDFFDSIENDGHTTEAAQ